jgi:hypothetical protein
MSWLFVLSIVLQALLIVHCIKTGRNQIWIWVLALLSFAGVIAYVAAELIPELLRGRTTQRAVRNVKRALDPQADLRRAENEARLTGNVASRQRYAEELAKQRRFGEAIEAYRQTLTGLYEHDPNLMLGLAQAQFGNGDAAAARATLDDLIRLNPEFKSPDGHLLYARALEAEGNIDKALEEYRVLASYYPGAEAPVLYARLLRAQGRPEEARKALRELLDHAKLAPAHYRKAQKEWLDEAEREARGS